MLRLCNISKSFGTIFTPILNDISLMIEPGDFCVLIGSNGSGKSTFIKSISGEYKLDSGSIVLDGKDITKLPIHKKADFISVVSQDITKGIVQEMSLLENLSLSQMRGRNARCISYKHNSNKLKEILLSLDFGIEAYINMPILSLSGGQRQMIATVMSMISKPSLLLLDEHCSALDPKMQVKVMEYTACMIAQKNITALMITHNLNDAIRYGNRLLMLHQGKIVLDIKDDRKQNMSVQQLLELFHNYEDSILIQQQNGASI